ncbi:MAG: hypothetical protein ACJ8HF_20165 [Pseudomonas sp.]
MIPEEFWKSWLAFWFMAGPTLLGFSSFLFCLYLSRRHLNAMMQALNNSRYIHLWGPAWRRRGWVGGIILIVKIAGMVVFPRANILSGNVDPTDIESFPPRLKRLLTVFLAIVYASLVWAVVVYLLMKFK